MGVGNVNRGMSKRDKEGVPNWQKALYGETGEAARKAQMLAGRKIAKQKKPKRKLWKVSA